MILRQFLYADTACASYVFGCTTHRKLGVVDPHVNLVERYLEAADAVGAPIVAVFETHVQADHVSGLPGLVAATGATGYLPAGARVGFAHHALEDGERVELGNTIVTALSTPGHAPAHHAYLVADLRRETDEPWLAFTGDSLLVNDAGRPDLHAAGGDPRALALHQHASMQRLLALPDHIVVLPSHYGGSVCGRGLSGNPISSIGFERLHNRALQHADADEFADELLRDLPAAPPDQDRIVAANRAGV
ncbi:MAG TPA: MBL fold metallo-hydrolase [Gaiellales bacterium]|jgi:glyoxylase-like metal-dependent hydrolase (beta-lactamase superfamily II)